LACVYVTGRHDVNSAIEWNAVWIVVFPVEPLERGHGKEVVGQA